MPAPIDMTTAKQGDYLRAFNEIRGTIYGALRLAFNDTAKQIQSQARIQIASAGLRGKWITGFRTYVFPRQPNDLSTELVIRGFHSYNIANVFERGAHVSGKPFLWVPLPSAPAKVRGKPTTAARLIAAGVRLRKIQSRGRPLLIGYIIRSSAGARRKNVVGVPGTRRLLLRTGSVTVQQLLNGQRNVRRAQTRSAFGGRRGPQSVPIPLFVGLSSVEIKKRLDINSIYRIAQLNLVGFYSRRVEELNK